MILDSLSYPCSTSEHVPKLSSVHLFQRCHTFPAAFSHTRSWHVVSVHAHQSSINSIKEQLTKLNDSYDQKCSIFFVIWWETPYLTVPGIHMKITKKNTTLQWMNCRFFNIVNIFLFSDFNLSKTNLYHILVMLLLQSTKWMHLRILRLILNSCCTSLLVTAAAAGKKSTKNMNESLFCLMI